MRADTIPGVQVHERKRVERDKEKIERDKQRKPGEEKKGNMCVLGFQEREGKNRRLRKGIGRGRLVMPANDKFGEPTQLPV